MRSPVRGAASPASVYSPGSLNDADGDGWLSDAVGSDYDEYSSSDYDSSDDGGGDEESPGKKRRKQQKKKKDKKDLLHPDIMFDGEFLYWAVKMVRGSTSGRQLKRTIAKLSLLLMLCCFPIVVMAYIEDRTFEVGHYFTVTSPAGAALQPLMWLTGAPGFLLGFGSLFILKHWASLCTNRLLLTNIARGYMLVIGCHFFIIVYTVVVLFLTFSPVKRWSETVLLVRIFPFFLCTCIFIMPLAVGTLLMLLDMSFFIDEIVNVPGSSIEEPDPPAEIMDLTDVTAQQLVLYVLSLPFVVFIQIFDLCVALLKAARRYILRERRKRLEASAAEYDEAANAAAKAAKKRQSGVLSRLVRTLRRCLCCCLRIKGVGGIGGSPSKNKILPGSSGAGGEGGGEEKAQELRATGVRDRELEERLAREALEEEAERKRQRDLRDAAEREAAEALRQRRESELAAAREAADMQEMRDKERLRMAPTLDVPTFKDKWSTLAAAGTFSCRLRALPELNALTEHMRTQGFHVVFASVPTPAEVELGICNIREKGTEPWFLARFLSSRGTFSAVMKSESVESAPVHVKKFALAKCLKIDASSVPRSPKHGQSTNSAKASGQSADD